MGISLSHALAIDGLKEGRIVAGAQNLDRQIEFVDIIETPIGSDWDIMGGLFVTTFYAIKDDLAEQIKTIDILHRGGCAVLVFQICVLDRLSEAVIRRADELGLPVVVVPREVTYPRLIQPLVGALLKAEADQLHRSEEMSRQLIDACLGSGGIEAVIRELAKILDRPVFVLDAWGAVVASARAEDAAALSALSNRMQRLERRIHATPVYLPELGAWLMKFLRGERHDLDGYLAIADPARSLDPRELVAIERASVVIVLEIAKRRAVAEAERTIRRDFIESLLSRGASGMADMNERAHSLGWNLSDKHLVVLLEPFFDSAAKGRQSVVGSPGSPQEHPATAMPPEFHDHVSMLLAGRDSGAILAEQGSRVVLLPTCGSGCDFPGLKSSLLELISLLGALLVRATHATGFRAGVGGFGKDEKGLWLSLREAGSVLDVVSKLALPPEVYWFDDLKLYCLLDRMSNQPETVEWIRHSIGPLLELDSSKGTQYVRTLEAYLDCCLRLKETAYLLNIHPKTLKYRLDKIVSILGVDLVHGTTLFDYHVACKMLRLTDTSRLG